MCVCVCVKLCIYIFGFIFILKAYFQNCFEITLIYQCKDDLVVRHLQSSVVDTYTLQGCLGG